jgi:uncharacterized protein with PQ loop repeat
MSSDLISNIFSSISLLFYSIVYLPQFYLIYTTKSADGVSTWMLILWSQADALSLFGTLLLYLPSNFVAIGWYHFLIGVMMIMVVLFYNKAKNNLELYSSVLFIFANTSVGIILNTIVNVKYEEIGSILGWITMMTYLVGRFPQIYMNWTRKTTEGLSLLMYTFTILGNLFYIGVIFSTPEYFTENIPWLITGIFSIILDVIIISQHYYYINKNKTKILIDF